VVQRVEVVLVDDIEGGPATETVQFGLDGVNFEIDVNEANAHRLREAMAPFVGHARRTGGRRATTTTRRPARTSETAQIRAWARERGLPVNERGRIPAEIVAQYEAAHA
jgi:hypothetical protein